MDKAKKVAKMQETLNIERMKHMRVVSISSLFLFFCFIHWIFLSKAARFKVCKTEFDQLQLDSAERYERLFKIENDLAYLLVMGEPGNSIENAMDTTEDLKTFNTATNLTLNSAQRLLDLLCSFRLMESNE